MRAVLHPRRDRDVATAILVWRLPPVASDPISELMPYRLQDVLYEDGITRVARIVREPVESSGPPDSVAACTASPGGHDDSDRPSGELKTTDVPRSNAKRVAVQSDD